MPRSVLVLIIFLMVVEGASAQPVPEKTLRDAAKTAIDLIQRAQGTWYPQQSCTSCHHQLLPAIAFAVARERGVAFDAKAERIHAARSFAYLKDLDAAVQGTRYIDDVDDAWKLVGADAAGVPRSAATAATAQFLASAQRADGDWWTFDARPPQSASAFTVTAVTARAVQLYLPAAMAAERDRVLAKARSWLARTPVSNMEDRTFRLLGLGWTGADAAVLKAAADQLLDTRLEDGGWGQMPGWDSDAYSTGLALYALHTAGGMKANDPIYQAGLRFLLKARVPADGSWRVSSRMHREVSISPDYFPSGFPHGEDHDFSSLAGTTWAAVALMLALPEAGGGKVGALAGVAPVGVPKWVETVLNGSAADVRAALAGGLDPNATTAGGTTALMLAARDPGKVEALLAKGADVAVQADSGHDALLVASRYRGNTEVMQKLLAKKAAVRAGPKPVQNTASAVFQAASVGDVEMVRLLLEAKANVGDKQRSPAFGPRTGLVSAAVRGDAAIVAVLLANGADKNESSADGTTVLMRAVLTNRAEVVRVLVRAGAEVNRKDAEGFTALAYAAFVAAGDTGVVELLLANGANRTLADNKGRTPAAHATANGHGAVAAVLGAK